MTRTSSQHIRLPEIGPNALIQTVSAWSAVGEPQTIKQALDQIAEGDLLQQDPTTMVAEQRFVSLVRMMAASCDDDQLQHILWRAGYQTGEYLLAHRIPKLFQLVLQPLPPQPSFRLLLQAIQNHAWTFVGSGTFCYASQPQMSIQITGSLGHHPSVAHFFAGTFACLFQRLVSSSAQLVVRCERKQNEFLFSYVVQIVNYAGTIDGDE